jgi:predicted metal-dependent phosphoesterase TrpH
VTVAPASATVDLQVHSTASDGSVAPAAIANAAAAAKLSAFALTDHDSVSGLAAATSAAAAFGIRVVAGVELSTLHAGREVHLLGLHVTALDVLDERLREFRATRAERAVTIVHKLRALGVSISFEDVQREAGTGALGRPHIARAIIASGACRDFREVFDRFLGTGRPAYVAKHVLSVRDAVDLIHATGGLAIWAHPGREGRRELLEALVADGLDGAEVLHPGHSPEDVTRLGALCDYVRILPSGGSDWHGETSGSRVLGAMHVPAEWLARQDDLVTARVASGTS